MIQADKIISQAVGLVGWRQPYDVTLPTLEAALIASRSGLIMQEGHGLVRIKNIVDTLEFPVTDPDVFNDRLSEITGNAFVDVCRKVFPDEDFITSKKLFPFENKFTETEDLGVSDFVGFQIDLSKCGNIAGVINNFHLEFNGISTVKILLFNSQKKAPIQSQIITTVANDRKTTFLQWDLSDADVEGGTWYIGYLTNGIASKPIKKNFELSNLQSIFPGAYIRPIRISNHSTETMFDPSLIQSTSESWGINFNMSIYNDFTQLIINNERRFAKALQLQVAVNLLDMFGTTTQSNRNERMSRVATLLELNGNRNNRDLPEHIGLYRTLEKEVKNLKQTFNPTGIVRMQLR